MSAQTVLCRVLIQLHHCDTATALSDTKRAFRYRQSLERLLYLVGGLLSNLTGGSADSQACLGLVCIPGTQLNAHLHALLLPSNMEAQCQHKLHCISTDAAHQHLQVLHAPNQTTNAMMFVCKQILCMQYAKLMNTITAAS